MVLGNGSPLAKVTPANTDPHMEALLDFYKDAANRKGKTATIVWMDVISAIVSF